MSTSSRTIPRILFHVNPAADYVPRFRDRIINGILNVEASSASISVKFNPDESLRIGLSAEEFAPDFLQNANILILSPFIGGDDIKKIATVLPKMPNLKWIHSFTAGVDAFSKLVEDNLAPECQTTGPVPNEEKVPLTNARGAFSHSLAEHAINGMLYFNKDIERLQKNKVEKAWNRYQMGELKGKKVGFIGFGSIAQATARLCVAFDMDIVVNRRTSSVDGKIETHFGSSKVTYTTTHASKQEVFSSCDYVVCTLPFTAQTKHYCDESCFSVAKQDQVFISLGRGQAIDESALIKHSSRFRGIVMDVFEKEPLSPDSPLWTLPNTLISAHNADIVPSYEDATVGVFLERYTEFMGSDFKGFSQDNKVDRSQGY